MLKKVLKKKIVKDAAFLSASHLVVQLCGLCGSLLTFRYLGPSNIGVTAFLQNYLTLFVTLFSGIDLYANWKIAASSRWGKKVAEYTLFKFVLVFLASILFLVTAKLFFPEDIFLLSGISLIPLFASIFGPYVFLIQFQNKIKLQSIAMVTSAVLLLLLKCLAVYFHLSLIYFIFITSLDGILLAVAAYFSLRRFTDSVNLMSAYYEGVLILKRSVFSVLYVYSWFFIIKIDQLFLPLFLSIDKLGLYSSAVKVTELANVFVVLLQSLLVPRVASLYEGKDSYRNMIVGLSVYFSFSVCISFLLSFFSPVWIFLLFGDKFQASSAILTVYAWTLPGIFITNFLSVLAFSKRKYRLLAFTGMGLLCLSAPLTYFAAHSGNVLFIAGVSVFIYSLSAVTLLVLWKKKML